MAFCAKCGHKLSDVEKFCTVCGTARISRTAEKDVEANASANEEVEERLKAEAEARVKAETEARIKAEAEERAKVEAEANAKKESSRPEEGKSKKAEKCPACGELLPSFTAFCPACGCEVKATSGASEVKSFIAQLTQYDIEIANNPAKGGWSSWSTLAKVGWVLLNLQTSFLPLIIYLLLPLFGLRTTKSDKEKAALVNNYTCPNDRESILEWLLFIHSQLSALSCQNLNNANIRWFKIWKAKAKQVYQRSEILCPGDKIAKDVYSNILTCAKEADKKLRKRSIIVVAIVAIIILVIAILIINDSPLLLYMPFLNLVYLLL